ncbi:MAG TPA: hypothetical protein VNG31_00265 [Candidatus Baltobacteraceae bacterium]|nr:hypothetical protein [Candidatus Baltobacteraceae bacterium]
MTGDFGTELDAALNAHVDALRSAADRARARIDSGVDALQIASAPAISAEAAAPIDFDLDEPVRRSRPAVSFDLEEDLPDLAVDSEGIPFPE